MNLLLDTQVWLWACEDPSQLGPKMRKILLDPRNLRTVCSISVLEIARLVWAGDLLMQIPVQDWVRQTLVDLRADSLPVTDDIALEAYRLPEPFHRDPADRLIVACARVHHLTLATADERILKWPHVAIVNAKK